MKNTQTLPELIPHKATHPGILIADELDSRDDLNQKDLAHLLDVKVSFLNEIIKGKRPITADTALVLEKALDIPADFWMKFQIQYDLDTARIKAKNIVKVQNIEIWSVIKNYVPVNSFKKLGYLTDDIDKNIRKIFEIFRISTIDELISQFAARRFSFYRKSQKLTIDEKNLFSWSALAEYEASLLEVNVFSEYCKEQLIEELNKCFYENENLVGNAKTILHNYGVKLIILEKFNKTPVDGYSFWSVNNPAIVLSCRHKRVDNLAFTIFHELGHVFLHLSKNKDLKILDIDDKENIMNENEADNFAMNNLISQSSWKKIEKNNFPLQDSLLLDLANELKVHPSIIFGRICKETKNYKVFTKIERAIN